MVTGSSDLAMSCTLEDDLFEDRGRNVLAGLGFVDREVLVALDHERQVLEGHVAARGGVVEAPVRVFLDRDRSRGSRHGEPRARLSFGQHSLFFSEPATVL